MRVIGALMAVVLLAVACGGDDGPAEDAAPEPVVELSTSSTTPDPTTTTTTTTTTATAVGDDPQPTPACAGATMAAHLGGDDGLDWLTAVAGEPGAPTTIRVCDSQRDAPWDFVGPDGADAIGVIDSDRDGIDDLILVGWVGVDASFFEVWVRDRLGGTDTAVPLLLPDGSRIVVGEMDGTERFLPGCGDADGDGRLGLVQYTSIGSDGWAGLEIVPWWNPAEPRVTEVSGGELLPRCGSAVAHRPSADAIPCASLPPWEGGEPFHGEGDRATWVEVESGDVLITRASVAGLWRGGKPIGVAAVADFGWGGAHHDLMGGVVHDTRDGGVVHLRADGTTEVLQEPDEDLGRSHRIVAVAEIDGVPTALAIRTEGFGIGRRGDLVVHPLDGSVARLLPSNEYSEGGTSFVDWDGERFVVIDGGEGYLTTRAMDATGTAVEFPWDRWAGEGFDVSDLELTFAVAPGRAWSAARTGYGLFLQHRDPVSGDVVHEAFDLIGADRGVEIDVLGDDLLVSTLEWEDACHRIYDPDTATFTELARGGTATAG